jgi:gamma-glutamylcyclotransferase (GGCT)/AIG2-like uncharacterized protein YtfP
MPEYLFVYGTLRRALVKNASPELATLMQGLRFVGSGKIHGQLYDLGAYPGAIVGENFETNIIGEIYELSEPRDVLEMLDVYEGFIPGELEASLFARIQAPVTLPDGQCVECWLYVYNDWVAMGQLIEHGDYAEYLQRKATLFSQT